FFSSRRRHTSFSRDWSSDVCSSDLYIVLGPIAKFFVGSGIDTVAYGLHRADDGIVRQLVEGPLLPVKVEQALVVGHKEFPLPIDRDIPVFAGPLVFQQPIVLDWGQQLLPKEDQGYKTK